MIKHGRIRMSFSFDVGAESHASSGEDGLLNQWRAYRVSQFSDPKIKAAITTDKLPNRDQLGNLDLPIAVDLTDISVFLAVAENLGVNDLRSARHQSALRSPWSTRLRRSSASASRRIGPSWRSIAASAGVT
jgi:hypothetical protein